MTMKNPENTPKSAGVVKSGKLTRPDKLDYWIALVLAILALAAYVRTLAPDILYGDSAEFQCLAYTLGITHSTGYPTYLFLGRLIGFLPVSNPAWRISLLSALCAAITVAGVYLLARYFTRSRVGAVLGSLALGISYTFWSQAVIAEVYTPGMAFLVGIMLLLFHWQTDPRNRSLSLLIAALLAGLSLGVHASVWLIAPPAVALVLWTLWKQRASRVEWIRALYAGFSGAVIGAVIFLIAFLVTDWLNSPTSFINTTLEPSRVFWKLQPEDFHSPFKRLKMTLISAQWGPALFPGGDFSFMKELRDFTNRLTKLEFPPLVLLFALVGVVVMLLFRPASGAFYPLAFLFSTFLILNYQVGDKYVFYLSLYIPLTVAAGTGIGSVLEWVHQRLETVPGRSGQILYLFPVLFFLTIVVQPSGASRWQALRNGVAKFLTVDGDYVFPVKNLKEPRLVAEMRLSGIEDNAVLVMDWRDMYTTAYMAHVEEGKKNMLFKEAMPAGNNGKVASTLITQIDGYLQDGRPVYVEWKYPGLEEKFRILPAFGNLYKLSLRK
jgi:hypothetical protein